MKNRLLLYFLLFLPVGLFAQNTEILKIDSLPHSGILLTDKWKYQFGDNPAWAQPEINDDDWKPIDPSLNIIHLPSIKGVDHLWLRLKLDLSPLGNEQLSLAIEQSGASQLFLNGKKIADYGLIHSDHHKTKAYNPLNKPLLFYADTSPIQTLAVRYAFEPGLNYRPVFNITYPLFKVNLASPISGIEQFRPYKYISLESFRIGISLMLFVVHIIFYLLYPAARSNLFLAIWAFVGAISTLYLVFLYNTNEVSQRNWNAIIASISGNISNIFLIYSIYLLLKQRPKKLLILFIVITALALYNSLFEDYLFRDQFSFILAIISALIGVLMAYDGFRQKIIGSLYLLWGCILYIVFWSLFFIGFIFNFNPIVQDVLFHLSIFVFPVSISAVLGLEIRYTNKSLSQKLEEVKALSEEKQQILSIQNEKLELQVKDRTLALSSSLNELKSTQAQLIQSEKMASLGELTAGIAHEIQNPLNFVNNFSEVNTELINEAVEELRMTNESNNSNNSNHSNESNHSNHSNQSLKDLLIAIRENEEKITLHGKRADSIVKGMLQHSQKTAGIKEPTDINSLCDEYLRLCYHGLRAKDKSFQAEIKTDFDPGIGLVNIVPQDIGRVVLNILTNAFYAAAERSNQIRDAAAERSNQIKDAAAERSNQIKSLATENLPGSTYGLSESNGKNLNGLVSNFIPTVSISTKKHNNHLEIKIKDNGSGISDSILDKIFQPFFTTKPTGQGTGLGLSLSYDIVRANQGSLKIKSEVGQGSEFIIELPL